MTEHGMTSGELVDRLGDMLDAASNRVIVGIAGAPGVGKSTLVAALAEELNARRPGSTVVVPLDGFHLAASVIAGDDRAERRGAPDTFDPAGYAHLMQRIRADEEPEVYTPVFSRDIEDPVAAGVLVAQHHRIVLTEGNYLLLDEPAWRRARACMDAVWFLDVDADLRRQRLLERHLRFGKTRERAEAFALGSDERNAQLIDATRGWADMVFTWAQ